MTKKTNIAINIIQQSLHDASNNICKIILGKQRQIQLSITCLLANGHLLIEDLPGVGKTTLALTIAKTFGLNFQRIQFTSDLLPADVLGVSIFDSTNNQFDFHPGPIFTQTLLADEINRTPPKTQSALLEAMQEYKVTTGGNTYKLPLPFFVLATQNPIEQEGTYPLPEAQLDRFMLQIPVDYPDTEQEVEMVMTTTRALDIEVKPVLNSSEVEEIQGLVRQVPIAESVVRYAVNLVKFSRPQTKESPDYIKGWVNWGASPRASQYLVLAAKARALISSRYAVSYEDIKAVAHPVLRHRILPSFIAEADGITSDQIIEKLIEETPLPENV